MFLSEPPFQAEGLSELNTQYDSPVLTVNHSHFEINAHNQYFSDVQSNKTIERNIFTTIISKQHNIRSFEVNDFHLFCLQWMRLSSPLLPGLRSDFCEKHLLK